MWSVDGRRARRRVDVIYRIKLTQDCPEHTGSGWLTRVDPGNRPGRGRRSLTLAMARISSLFLFRFLLLCDHMLEQCVCLGVESWTTAIKVQRSGWQGEVSCRKSRLSRLAGPSLLPSSQARLGLGSLIAGRREEWGERFEMFLPRLL